MSLDSSMENVFVLITAAREQTCLTVGDVRVSAFGRDISANETSSFSSTTGRFQRRLHLIVCLLAKSTLP